MAKEKQETLVSVSDSQLVNRTEFENVYDIISFHKKRAMKSVHNESLLMLWEVGGYVSGRLKQSAWGDGVVRMLADYIRTRSPKAKGWSYRTLYKMVQFYDTYSTTSFKSLVEHYGMQHYLADASQNKASEFVPVEMAQFNINAIVPFEMAQIPSVLLYRLSRCGNCGNAVATIRDEVRNCCQYRRYELWQRRCSNSFASLHTFLVALSYLS